MNKERRSKIKEISFKIETILNELKEVVLDEELAYDGMPENLQGSDRGIESEEAIDNMNNVVQYLEDSVSDLSEII